MCAFPPNPFAQQLSMTPGRIVTGTERYHSPTGQTVDLLDIDQTVQDASGTWRTDVIRECVPPLADGVVPATVRDIRECIRCASLVHVDNSYACPACGHIVCCVCTAEVRGDGDKAATVRLCANCAARVMETPMKKLLKWIWG